jgi:hypothetical protein
MAKASAPATTINVRTTDMDLLNQVRGRVCSLMEIPSF